MASDTPVCELPLFPLQTAVFPGSLLPLQVFEWRYLKMIGACERTDTPFGVVTLTRGGEVHRPGLPSEQFHPVGTRMRLEKVLRPQPGLLQIWCRALETFEVQRSWQQGDGLWLAEVTTRPPESALPVPAHLQHLAVQMVEALQRLQENAPAPLPWPLPWRSDDCAWLSQRWCELLPLPTATRYHLLALTDPLMRLELVGDMVRPDAAPG